jgi:hypothetical protein
LSAIGCVIDSIRISAESKRNFKQASFESGLRLIEMMKSISTSKTEPVQMRAIARVEELMATAPRAADPKFLKQKFSVDSLLQTGGALSMLLRRWIDADLTYDPANHRELH